MFLTELRRRARRFVSVCIITMCALIFMVNGAYAATSSVVIELKNSVTQRAIADAQVVLVSRNGDRFQVQTNAQGNAKLNALPAGLYEVLIERVGYQNLRLPSVRLTENKSMPLQLSMVFQDANIEEVLVVGSTLGANRLDSVSAGSLDREALRSSPGSGGDVLRALDGLPGLFSDGEFSGFTVRGGGPRDNLILVDGVPFRNVVHFSDSFGELDDAEGGGRYSVFAPNTIVNAEFQPGGWTAAYGGRSGSLLKLDVANGNAQTPSYSVRLDVAGPEFVYDGPSFFHQNTSLLFSARQLDFGRFFESIGIDDIGQPKLTDVIVKTRTDFDNGNYLEVLGIYAPESFSRTLDNVFAVDEDNPGVFDNAEITDAQADNNLLVLTWGQLVGDTGELTNKLYYRGFAEQSQSGEAEIDGATEQTPVNEIDVRFPITTANRDETELGWRLDYGQDNRLGRFTTGLRVAQLDLDFGLTLDNDWIRYEFDTTDPRPQGQDFIVLTPELVNTAYQATGLNYALYGEQIWAFDDWDIRTGLRFDADELTDDSAISPRFSAAYSGFDRLRITTTLGRYLQSPFLGDRARDPRNTRLSFEKNDQISVGFKYDLSRNVDVFIEPYYQSLSDVVVEQNGLDQTFANTGEGEALGLDMAITRYFARGWSANASYSYNKTRIKETPTSASREAEFSRPHTLALGGIWEINTRWKVSGIYKLASGRLRDAFVVNSNVLGEGEPVRFSKEVTEKGVDRFEAFSTLNVRVDYQRAYRDVQIIAFLDVLNVLGSANPSRDDFNERTGLVEEEEGNAFPFVGLRFEW